MPHTASRGKQLQNENRREVVIENNYEISVDVQKKRPTRKKLINQTKIYKEPHEKSNGKWIFRHGSCLSISIY